VVQCQSSGPPFPGFGRALAGPAIERATSPVAPAMEAARRMLVVFDMVLILFLSWCRAGRDVHDRCRTSWYQGGADRVSAGYQGR
jgi:hypothetical protein